MILHDITIYYIHISYHTLHISHIKHNIVFIDTTAAFSILALARMAPQPSTAAMRWTCASIGCVRRTKSSNLPKRNDGEITGFMWIYIPWRILTVLLYRVCQLVCHGSHQYIPQMMLAYIQKTSRIRHGYWNITIGSWLDQSKNELKMALQHPWFNGMYWKITVNFQWVNYHWSRWTSPKKAVGRHSNDQRVAG